MRIIALVAMDENGLIGNNDKLPWHLHEDLVWFKEKTMNTNVVMGNNTFKSLAIGVLPHRHTLVMTRNPDMRYVARNYPEKHAKVTYINSFDDVFHICFQQGYDMHTPVYCAGGAEIYKKGLAEDVFESIIITRVHAVHSGNTYFPKLPIGWTVDYQKRTEQYSRFILRKPK